MEDWRKLHFESTVVDLHTHPALKSAIFHRDLSTDNKRKFLMKLFGKSVWPATTRTDFPKMEAGGVDIILSTVYAPEMGWLADIPIIKWLGWLKPSAYRRMFKQPYFDIVVQSLDDIESQIVRHNQKVDAGTSPCARRVRHITNVRELDATIADGYMGVIHSVEGAHSLHGPECTKEIADFDELSLRHENEVLNNLQILYDRGAAYLTLAHFYPNACTESPVFPYPEYGLRLSRWKGLLDKWDHTKGLTPIGEAVVERMLELGMLIDITHMTPPARARVYQLVEHHKKGECLLASHTGAYSVNPDPYALQDWELSWMGNHGCVVGVIFMNYWLSPVDTKMGLKYIMQTIDRITRFGGVKAAAIGSDFDGMTDPPDELTDMSHMPRLTRELASVWRSPDNPKYSEEDIGKILGGNALRLLRNGWGQKG
jgi:microsomal dipeptidase-like Zn-dependent dipeptidase